MGRQCCWVYYPRLRLFSLPAFFCSFPVSPQCSASSFLSFPLCIHLPFQWPADGPRALVSPCISSPTWLWMVPTGASQMAAWFAERQEQVIFMAAGSVVFMFEGTGPAKHFILSRDRSRPTKWLSGTHPAEEPYVMQAWYNLGTSRNPLNIVHPRRPQIPLCWDLSD